MDFIALARAMGVHAIRCSSAEELPEKMKELLEHPENKPVLLECIVSRTEHVFPMVRPNVRSHSPVANEDMLGPPRGRGVVTRPSACELYRREVRVEVRWDGTMIGVGRGGGGHY